MTSRLWVIGAAGLLTLVHVVGLVGASRTSSRELIALLAIAGFPAVPLVAWLVSRGVDRLLDRLSPHALVAWILRLLLGAGAVTLAPLLLTHHVGLVGFVVPVLVATGLLLSTFGVADGLYRLTDPFRHLSTRLMVLLTVAALGTLLSVSVLLPPAAAFLSWAVTRGRLDAYAFVLSQLALVSSERLGAVVGAIILTLPFMLVFAWRFAQNATRGLRALSEGFERARRGEIDTYVEVTGNDEVADMQKNFNAMLGAARERRFLEAAFSRYVSPVLLERLRRKSDGTMRLPGERRVATVLFSDIRGFTAMSATMSPEETIAILNTYMSEMIDCIARYDGYINKFVGDAIMVIWNAPLDQPRHALMGLACAQGMQEALARLNEEGAFGTRKLEMGIGINTGPLVAGNLGNQRQVEFTVIGDTVNVASRACHHARAHQVALTPTVLEAVGHVAGEPHVVQVESLGTAQLKGRGEMELFALRTSAEVLWRAVDDPLARAADTSVRQLVAG